MASKFVQFLKASWNAIFSTQEAPRRASAADRRSGWSRPEAPGGGFRRGKTRDRLPEPLRQELGPRRWAWKDKKTWMFYLTRRPELGGGLKPPWGGVPPPLVFEVGRFVAWKEVLKDCVVKLGVLFKSWVMRGFWGDLGRSGAAPEQVLGRSWAAPGHLGRLLAGYWAVLGFLGESSARPGLLLGVLVGSWSALGLSWAALGRSWMPSWSQVGFQEAQSQPQDLPKSRPRRSKMALRCKTVFRTPLWGLRENFWKPFSRMLDTPRALK